MGTNTGEYNNQENHKNRKIIKQHKNETNKYKNNKNNKGVTFDIDSQDIGIDNRCSACISHDKNDFLQETIKKTNKQIVGFGGMRHGNISQGTIIWNIADDNGKQHEFKINNAYLVPEGGVRLLSPQNWAKEYKSKTGKGEWEITDDSQIQLIWENGKYTRTARLTNGSNIGNITTYEGYKTHRSKLKEMSIKEDNT